MAQFPTNVDMCIIFIDQVGTRSKIASNIYEYLVEKRYFHYIFSNLFDQSIRQVSGGFFCINLKGWRDAWGEYIIRTQRLKETNFHIVEGYFSQSGDYTTTEFFWTQQFLIIEGIEKICYSSFSVTMYNFLSFLSAQFI